MVVISYPSYSTQLLLVHPLWCHEEAVTMITRPLATTAGHNPANQLLQLMFFIKVVAIFLKNCGFFERFFPAIDVIVTFFNDQDVCPYLVPQKMVKF